MVANLPASEKINVSFVIPSEQRGQLYPALQADNYQPRVNDKVRLCMTAASIDCMSPDTVKQLGEIESGITSYGATEVEVFYLPEDLRFVVLSQPKLFLYNKAKEPYQIGEYRINGESYGPLVRGVKLAGTKLETATKLYLAVVNGENKVVTTDKGEPQIFTLKINSTKCALIGNMRDKDLGESSFGGKTLASLNKALETHYNTRGWLTHLVSIPIRVSVETFTSSVDRTNSSIGIKFVLGEGARPLSMEDQERVFNLVSTDEFKTLSADPFGLYRKSAQESAQSKVIPMAADDSIPF